MSSLFRGFLSLAASVNISPARYASVQLSGVCEPRPHSARLYFAVALSMLTPSRDSTPQLLLIVNDPVSSRLYRRKLYKLDLSRGLWVSGINQGLESFSTAFIFSFCSYNLDEILSRVVALKLKSAEQDVWRGVNDDNFPSLFLSNCVFTPTQPVIENVTRLTPRPPPLR